MAQLVRKISPPSAALPAVAEVYWASGTPGPGASDPTYAASWLTSSPEKRFFASGACGPGSAIGIRPVPTWKSTDAAPTPIRLGPAMLPRLSAGAPAAFRPWQLAQFARKSFLPAATSSALVVAALAGFGASAAYAAPVASRPRAISSTSAKGWRRRAASAVTCGSSSRTVMRAYVGGRGPAKRRRGRRRELVRFRLAQPRWPSLEQVDGGEQGDPDHVDEVPVVRGHDGAGGLRMPEPASRERASDDQQEGDQASRDVQAVEARREVEDRAVAVSADLQPLTDQAGVLVHLSGDEDGAEEIGEGVPLPHAPQPQL